jgi:hypothetical protein
MILFSHGSGGYFDLFQSDDKELAKMLALTHRRPHHSPQYHHQPHSADCSSAQQLHMLSDVLFSSFQLQNFTLLPWQLVFVARFNYSLQPCRDDYTAAM